MKKMIVVCLMVLSIVVVACSSSRSAGSDNEPVSDGVASVPDPSLADQANSGVSDVDTLTTELDSADADTAAGELEKLNW